MPSSTTDIDEQWAAYVTARRAAEVNAIIEQEDLRPDETRVFVETAFRDGEVKTTGAAMTKVLPPVARFSSDASHSEKKQRVLEKLGTLFERFFGLG
ncbi:type I restriction endonuclease subunit R, EcoR124 family [Plantibacter sp. 2H11-2]|uniref:type I restriction endonuclease subunit R, EcoR124 family n=1 Tax=Plantibacter sp. 2H11-2 TaxID=3414431 RepID=UPI003CEF1FAE